MNARHAIRPLPFYELVEQSYTTVGYLDANCVDIQTAAIPQPPASNQVFLQQSPVCGDRPWAALYPNDLGNLGMILASWDWSTGDPELLSYTEPIAVARVQEPDMTPGRIFDEIVQGLPE